VFENRVLTTILGLKRDESDRRLETGLIWLRIGTGGGGLL
jgi:hypothetical protein